MGKLMSNPRRRGLISFFLVILMLPYPRAAKAQDLINSESLAGGASVFVFRESRSKPQSRASGGNSIQSGSGRANAGRSNAQIVAAAQKRRSASIAAQKQATRASANRRLALSDTLTAKAETFLDSNQTDAAITNYRDALVQNPQNARAANGLGNALTVKGIEVAGDTNSDKAVVYFDEAVKIDKNNDAAYAKLGAIYDANGDLDRAISNYEKAVAINPDYSMIYPRLGLSYLIKGEIAKADAALKNAEAAGVDNIDLWYLNGVVRFKQNKNDEALTAFNRVVGVDGKSAEAEHYRGQIFERMENPVQAIAAFTKALEIDPSFTPASFDLGVAYYNRGEYDKAVAAYQHTIKHEPKNYQAHANLASTYRQQEKFSAANAEFAIASEGIKTAELYTEWGYCQGRASEWDKSIASLSSAKEINPNAIENSNLGWAHYNAANAQKEAKDTEGANANYGQAKSYLEVAVEKDPKLDAAYLNLGSTHNALGDFEAAVAVLKTVLSFRSDWLVASNQLGVGYRGLNDLANAVATFKRVIETDGNNLYGLFSLGEAYNASGNKKEAKKINDRLKKLDPALATRLDNIISGKAVVDSVKQKINQKIPKFPRFP